MEAKTARKLLESSEDPLLTLRPVAARGAGAVGVFARASLPRGTFVGAYTGELVRRPACECSTYAFELGDGWAIDPGIIHESVAGPVEKLLHVCMVHFINEPAQTQRCNTKFYVDGANSRILAQTLEEVQAGDELVASYGSRSRRRRCTYQVHEAECSRHGPVQLVQRKELGAGTQHKRVLEAGQGQTAAEILWQRCGADDDRVSAQEIDFSEPSRRSQVMAEVRIAELFGRRSSSGDVCNDESASSTAPQRNLRQRISGGQNSNPGCSSVASPAVQNSRRGPPRRSVEGSSASQEADDSCVAVAPPPSQSGSIDMLVNDKVILEDGQLPSVHQLRTWTQASQRAFWRQRLAVWSTKDAAELQGACTSNGLWPGGRQPEMRKRLALLEYQPSSLKTDDWLGGTLPLAH